MPLAPSRFPHTDSRYIKWRLSLKKRDCGWNRGLTKDSDPRVRKISLTMRAKHIDNFKGWREKARNQGLIPQSYPAFMKTPELAFLIGITLGDGHISQFPRSERLEIALGTDKPALIEFTTSIVSQVFSKEPKVIKVKYKNMVKLSLYQKHISRRLGIPLGNRSQANELSPKWINEKQTFLLAYLRGLFEAEASLCIHLPTSTYNFAFSNKNTSLLSDMEGFLLSLGLHPERRPDAIRLRRKREVKYFEKLIGFRQYDAGWSNGSLVAL